MHTPLHRLPPVQPADLEGVISRLKPLGIYKEDELREAAERLTTVKGLLVYFDHLLEEQETGHVGDPARIRLAIRVNGSDSVDRISDFISVVKFLECDDVEFIGKRVAIVVDDVLLEWGQEDIIIPQRISAEDSSMQDLETNFDFLLVNVQRKTQLIMDIINSIIRYNSLYLYHHEYRNSLQFVKNMLKVAHLSLDFEAYELYKATYLINHDYLDVVLKKIYATKQLGEVYEYDLRIIKRAYDDLHRARGENCTIASCQYQLLLEAMPEEGNYLHYSNSMTLIAYQWNL